MSSIPTVGLSLFPLAAGCRAQTFVDRRHALVSATDNSYAALGKQRSVVTEHDLRDALDAVLAGRAVAKPEVAPIGCYIPDFVSAGRH
jgi:hypothetical protein